MASLAAQRPAPLLRLFGYVGGATLLAALLTPPLFWAGRWAVHTALVPGLAPFGMPTYFRRALLVLLLLGVPWIWRSELLHEARHELRAKLRHQLRPFALGAALSLGALGFMLLTLWAADKVGVRPHGSRLGATGQALATGLCVGIVEELIFRGLLLTLAVARLGARRGHLFVVTVFACLHFVAPVSHGPVNEQIGWLDGLGLLTAAFAPLSDPAMWLTYGTVLVVLGDALGTATLRTRGLGLAMGLHAGLVFGARLTRSLMVIAPDAERLLTPDVRGGLAALLLVAALDAWVRLVISSRAQRA